MFVSSQPESQGLRERTRGNRWLIYLAAPLIVMLLVVLVFYIEGIWPLGTKTIAYGDMAQGYIPRYYHLYDAMHGTKSLFFDWYSGAGVNMVANLSTYLSPINLMFYFIPRDMLLQSMSLFLVIKMALMALTSFIFLKRVFPKLSCFFQILFSVMYAFSGYVLLYYTNIMWLETVIIFPILILTLLMLLEKDKIIPYMITFTLCLFFSFYLTFMTTLFVLFASGLYIFILLPKEKIKKSIFNLGIGTVVPFLLSACAILPEYLQMSKSSRLAESSIFKFAGEKISFLQLPDLRKLLMLLGIELFLVILFKFAFRGKAFRKQKTFFFSLIAMMVTPIFIESVNLMWHAGSYMDFPLRFGFMITFVLICACAYYMTYCDNRRPAHVLDTPAELEGMTVPEISEPKKGISFIVKLKKNVTEQRVWSVIKVIMIFAIFCVSIPLLVRIYTLLNKYGIYLLNRNDNQLYQNIIMVSILYIVAIGIAFSFVSKKMRNAVLSVSVVFPLLFYSAGLVGVERYASTEHNSSYIEKTLAVKSELPVEEKTVFDRIKDKSVQLNTNYPFILERSALSNWTHLIPESLIKSLQNFGYSNVFTRTLDAGGTAFSDALFGVKNVLSLEEENPSLYKLVGETGGFHYYESIYTLPFGIMADQTILNPLPNYICDTQNSIYKSISGESEDILKQLTRSQADESKIITTQEIQGGKSFLINVKAKEVLYFWSTSTNLTLSLNGKPVKIPALNNADNVKYKTTFNNKMIELGTFENQTVQVVVQSNSKISDDAIRFATLSLEKMAALSGKLQNNIPQVKAGDSRIEMTVHNGNAEHVLFIPVGYDAGWNCTVNGKNVSLEKAAGGFMAIPLENGTNEIKMNFMPQGMIPGIIISVVSLLGLIGVCIIVRKKKGCQIPMPILTTAKYIYIAVLICAALAVYAIPIGCSIYQAFK